MNILKINGEPLTGIWVDAAQSFNKPAKNVSTYSIPGRNGDLVIDEGTFENVLISYPVYEKSTFPAEFDEIVNKLAALEGYQRIECSNDPQHYRLGRFVVPQNPTAKRLNRDGYYQLSFDCKPQRFLISGDEAVEFTAEGQEEVYGPSSIASFEAEEGAEVRELTINLEPIQSGTGDPSSTNVRPIYGHTEAQVTRTGKNLFDQEAVFGGLGFVKQSDGSWYLATLSAVRANTVLWENKSKYTGRISLRCTRKTLNSTGAEGGRFKWKYTDGTTASIHIDNSSTYVDFSNTSKSDKVVESLLWDYGGGTNSTWFKDVQVEFGSTATAYEPYTGQTYNVPLGQTVYGGTLDVAKGKIVVDSRVLKISDVSVTRYTTGTYPVFRFRCSNREYGSSVIGICSHYAFYGNSTLSNLVNHISDKQFAFQNTADWGTIRDDDYQDAESFKSAMGDCQIWFKLIESAWFEISLTPTQVSTLLGQNNIFADAGEVEVKVTTPTVFNNPSLFNSKPLIRVYGTGTFRVNDITVTIASHDKPYIDIDCELQECYYGTENMNEYVSFSGNDFPELQPGDNYMLLASGITKLDITPRWWIL